MPLSTNYEGNRMIQVFPAEHTIRVELPYEIKDAFRAAFPAARYDGYRRYWLLSSAAADRLGQWIDVVVESGVLDAIALYDQAAMTASELAATRQRLAELRLELLDGADRRERDEAYKRRLARLREQLSNAREELLALASQVNH